LSGVCRLGLFCCAIALRHVSVEATLAELQTNEAPLRRLIGIEKEGAFQSWNISRFSLALRIDERVDVPHSSGCCSFGLGVGATASREIVHAANARAEFVQPSIDRVPPPAEDLFGSTRITLGNT